MMTIMEACKAASLPARWLHDAIIVPVNRREEAARLMLQEFVNHSGGARCGVTSAILAPEAVKGVMGVVKERFVFAGGEREPLWESKCGPAPKTVFYMPDGSARRMPSPPPKGKRGMPYAVTWAKHCREIVEVATSSDSLMLGLYDYFAERLRGMGAKSYFLVSLILVCRVVEAFRGRTSLAIMLPGEAVVVGVLP